ncbi:ABC-three component system protein [Sporanaerobacter sp. PP17-6a]|uniref:ABC-three component system protein n=1 Tax=Sporanaerobacter sp. PP17-6a TaxID=1891289 RepID=UPI00089FB4A3|nr:ABC-three component system protein [Sporanaerobacter sp. PP17-6a]SCL85426.1 hypothetical protein PP176A_0859 [Sporanaerobacter sp. PP17-6a]
MSRGNDAIPSWSGYNYQGKITLLATLIKINELLAKNKDLNQGMYIEIEKNEDFIIYEDDVAKSLYQVKAYLATTKISSYNSAMEKLINHRNDISAIGATCFLCIPLDVEDWGNSINTYSNIIKIYKPYGTCVELEEAPNLIKQEIEKVLFSQGLPATNKEDIYLELCNYLDNKISNMHIQGKEKRDYKIFMNDVFNFILDKHLNIQASDEAKQKEKVYEHIIVEFKNAVDRYCNNHCIHKKMGVCYNDIYGICSLYKSYEFIANINIWEYCRYINPHVDDGWDKPLNYISNMSEDSFSKLLIPVFNTIMAENVDSNNNIIYCNTNIYDSEDSKVIPTLLTFYSGLIPSETAAQDKLKKIKYNSFVFSGVSGNIITADTCGLTYNTESDSILFFRDSEDSKENDIRNLKDSIRIVDSREFIEKLRKVTK